MRTNRPPMLQSPEEHKGGSKPGARGQLPREVTLGLAKRQSSSCLPFSPAQGDHKSSSSWASCLWEELACGKNQATSKIRGRGSSEGDLQSLARLSIDWCLVGMLARAMKRENYYFFLLLLHCCLHLCLRFLHLFVVVFF